jgi:ubiquinone/menaquinone biosynthesis C-methylase UbiE
MAARRLGARVFAAPLVARLYETRLWRRSPVVAALLGMSVAREQATILDGAALAGNERVLDVACGTGLYTRAFARRLPAGRVIGLDAAAAMLREARRRTETGAASPLVRADAAALPFATAAFDRVHCGAALHLLADLDAALGEMRRVLRPGGLLTASVVERRGAAARLVAQLRGALGVTSLARPALTSRLRAAGFASTEVIGAGRGWLLLRSRA